jgi:hypothetical protein
VILIDEWSRKNESMRLVSVHDRHQVLQGFVRELMVNCERTAGHHYLDCFASLAFLVELELLTGECWWVDWTDGWLPNPVDVELLGITEAFCNNNFTFKERVLWHLSQIESESAALLVVRVKEPNCLLLQLLIFCREVDDSSTDSLACLDWRVEVLELFHLQLLLHDVFDELKLVLQSLSSGVGIQVE